MPLSWEICLIGNYSRETQLDDDFLFHDDLAVTTNTLWEILAFTLIFQLFLQKTYKSLIWPNFLRPNRWPIVFPKTLAVKAKTDSKTHWLRPIALAFGRSQVNRSKIFFAKEKKNDSQIVLFLFIAKSFELEVPSTLIPDLLEKPFSNLQTCEI